MIEAQDKCITEYKKVMDAFPVLSKKEESELLNSISKYKEGEIRQQARETLFNANIRLVFKEASHYMKYLPSSDLMNAGCEGLWIATERFDTKFKTRFSTYAVPWIRLKLSRLSSELGSMVYVPIHIKSKGYKYKALMEIDESITDDDIMKELNVNKGGLAKIRLAQTSILSLERPYENGDKDGESTLADFIPDNTTANPVVETQLKERKELIHQMLDELTPLQKEVLTYRYLMGEKIKLSTIGSKLNLSGERVRQIEYKAFMKLRRRIKNKTDFILE